MSEFLSRTKLLIGEEAVKKLQSSKVAVFGLGGVGSFTVEALARSGVGSLILCDNDVISPSNVNRQLFALNSTIGKLKVDVAKERLLDINPNLKIETYPIKFGEETCCQFDLETVDYVCDAIDDINGKVLLIKIAKSLNKSIISCFGTANKLTSSKFEITDVYNTSVCPLAKIMRNRLKKEGVESLKVLYSKEAPQKKVEGKILPSIAFVPSVAGLMLCEEIVKDLIGK